MPLYRGEDIFALAGMFIPRNTQFGMLANMAALIAPLRALMKSRVVSGRVIGVDDTSVAAARAMAMYRGLYDVEDRVREASADERLELRQRESVPLMNEFHNWLIAQRSDPRVLPKSSPGKAVRYALNQWDELSVFPGDGAIPFDNNETESELRSLTIGRQNWLFVGSDRGGEVAAAMYSLVSSAARHSLDVWAYVDDCLRRLAGGCTDYESLLPDVWRGSHPESIRVYRDAEKKSRRLTTQQRRVRRPEARVA